jgi:dipeptide/tripeptide permease
LANHGGGFLAPLVCGTLGEFYGWHWGFAAAGIGMFLGWSSVHHAQFFVILSALAAGAAAMLLTMDRSRYRLETERAGESAATR